MSDPGGSSGNGGNGGGEDQTGRDVDDVLSTDPLAMTVRNALNEPTMDNNFRQQLRDRLVAEADVRAAAPPSRRRHRATRRAIPAAAALAAAVLLVIAIVAPGRGRIPTVAVAVSSSVAGFVSVDPSSSVLVHFSQPMDHRSVEAALQIEPAVAVLTSWRGDDLLVTAPHGLAPNTGYLIGFDPARVRTASGARPQANPYVAFGTAPVAPSRPPTTPTVLALDTVAPADDGSEAVITADGSVLGTALRAGTGPSSLARKIGASVQPIAPATGAICVSRSGRSIAYLLASGPKTSIVMANGAGLNGRALAAQVDSGSPLGWIGDSEVSFVSGGALEAIDRTGRVRTLVAGPIHPETDTVSIAPGGRWIFLGSPGGQTGGRVVDVQTGTTRPLPAAAGSPAFSADGATIYWVDGRGTAPRLAISPSAGGPVLEIPLPVAAADKISDLGVNPDGSLLLYTLHHADGRAQLRLADLPTGSTLAESDGAGQSPNWSATGDEVAVLVSGRDGSQIDLIRLGSSLHSVQSAVEQTANAFARAQIGQDLGAMGSLSAAGLDRTKLPHPSRSSLLVATRRSATTWGVALRLLADPSPDSPFPRAAVEALIIDTSSGRPVVTQASSPPLQRARAGPHLTGITFGSGSVALTFDSDLDPATLAGIVLAGPDGQPIAVSLRYDSTGKVVTADGQFTATVRIKITGGLKDIKGRGAAPLDTIVNNSASG